MVRISNTELDHDEVEGKILDFYLGGETETKEQWARRVWDCCERKAQGEDLPRVYSTKPGQTWKQRALELWNNKKQKRKEGIKLELNLKDEELANIDKHPLYQTRSQKYLDETNILG